jgi:uncharacterized membrane protein YdbT with pleckstrin-like domain
MSWYLLIAGVTVGLCAILTSSIMLIFNLPSIAVLTTVFSILGAGAILTLIKLISAVLSYKNNALAINQGKVTAYSGGFTKNVTVLMAKNLVSVEDITTPLRKKAGITSLVMHLKTNASSNEVKVHIQDEALSSKLEELLVL